MGVDYSLIGRFGIVPRLVMNLMKIYSPFWLINT